MEAHTSYPILRHHSIISGIESLFTALPDFRIASTTAKLLCKVLRVATASCDVGELGVHEARRLLLAYCVCAGCHCRGRGEKVSYL